MSELYFNNASTTLSGNGGSITAGATTMNLAGNAGISGSGTWRCVIGTEIIIATAGAGTTTWSSLTRGAEGTTAASHNDGDAVTVILTAGSIKVIPDYASSSHSLTAHTGNVLPAANQTLGGNLNGDTADSRSIGDTNRMLLAAAKTIRTEDVAAATPAGGAAGDVKVGTNAIWARSGALWFKVNSSIATTTPLYDYIVFWDGALATATNLLTGTVEFSGADFATVRNQCISKLSLRPYPGGNIRYFTSDPNSIFPVSKTLHTCPGVTEWWPGDGKRGSTGGRNVGIIAQATTGFVGSPMLSYLNQAHQQPPTAAPTGVVAAGGSLTIGDHYYAYSWTNGSVESPLSPPSTVLATTSGNQTINLTLPTPPAWATSGAIVYRMWTVPPVETVGTPTAGGSVDVGSHKWGVTWTNNNTESLMSSQSGATVIAGNKTVPLTAVPLGAANTTKRTIYRTKAGGTKFYKVGDINDNTTTTFSDTFADSSLGVEVWGEFRYARNDLMWKIGTAAGTTFADTFSDNNTNFVWNGTPYYRNTSVLMDCRGQDATLAPVGGVAGNVTGTVIYMMTFTIAGVEVEGAPIASVTVSNLKVTVTLPIGPTGTTARTVYRTAASGTTFKKLTNGLVSDNTTTTLLDNDLDASLGTTLDATIPTILPAPRENLTINGFTADCNGNAAGSQGADIFLMVKGAGLGNQARLFECDAFNFNQQGYRAGFSGEEVGSCDTQIVDCAASTNAGTNYNACSILGIYCGDFAFSTANNFAAPAGQGVACGVHIRAGSANVRLGGATHAGGGGGGHSNIMVDSCNNLWIENNYLDNIIFPVGSIWLRPVGTTSIGRLTIKDNIINHNADVPFITFDGGKSSSGAGGGVSFVKITGNVSPGYSAGSKTQAVLKFVNGFPNAKGIRFSDNIFASSKKDALTDSTGNNGTTVTLDSTWGNMMDTASQNPVNMLEEQFGTATFAAATTVVVTHNLRAAPLYVLATPVTNITLWITTITATQFTINASASQSTTVAWFAKAPQT